MKNDFLAPGQLAAIDQLRSEAVAALDRLIEATRAGIAEHPTAGELSHVLALGMTIGSLAEPGGANLVARMLAVATYRLATPAGLADRMQDAADTLEEAARDLRREAPHVRAEKS